MLPRGSRFAEQLDTGLLKFVDSRLQVTHSEADNWTGTEMLLPWVAAAKYLDMAAIGQLEDPEVRLGIHQPEPKNVFVEVRQFSRATGTRAAPAQPCDFHVCQYRHHLGGMARTQQRTRLCPCVQRPSRTVTTSHHRLPGFFP